MPPSALAAVAESVAIAYAQGELHLFAPYAEPMGLGAYQVRSHHG
jgi:hypothetical protein